MISSSPTAALLCASSSPTAATARPTPPTAVDPLDLPATAATVASSSSSSSSPFFDPHYSLAFPSASSPSSSPHLHRSPPLRSPVAPSRPSRPVPRTRPSVSPAVQQERPPQHSRYLVNRRPTVDAGTQYSRPSTPPPTAPPVAERVVPLTASHNSVNPSTKSSTSSTSILSTSTPTTSSVPITTTATATVPNTQFPSTPKRHPPPPHSSQSPPADCSAAAAGEHLPSTPSPQSSQSPASPESGSRMPQNTTRTKRNTPDTRAASNSSQRSGSGNVSSSGSAPKRARQAKPAAKVLPRRYEHAEIKDLVVLISNMIMELIRFNDEIPLRDGRLTRFHSRSPPRISVHDYLQRIATHATLSPPILLSMVYYIDRLCAFFPAFTVSSLTVHRFLITAATVASKGLSDSFWTNKTYARVGGITIGELALLEIEFLWRVDWRIVPQPEVLVDYYRSLVERCEDYVMEPEPAVRPSTQSNPRRASVRSTDPATMTPPTSTTKKQ